MNIFKAVVAFFDRHRLTQFERGQIWAKDEIINRKVDPHELIQSIITAPDFTQFDLGILDACLEELGV